MDLVPFLPKRSASAGPDLAWPRFRDEVRDLFERVLRDPWNAPWRMDTNGAPEELPTIDVQDGEEAMTVRAELPGVSADDVQVEVSGNVLTLGGERSDNKEWSEGDRQFSEQRASSYRRSITLPSTVDAEGVSATHKDGVLTVTLPKQPGARPRKITVRNA